ATATGPSRKLTLRPSFAVRCQEDADRRESSFSAARAAGALLSGGSCSAGPVIAALSGGLAGYIDDFYESAFSRTSKGLRGHLGALSRGHLTSGALKIVIIGVGAALAGKLPADRGLPSSKRFALHAERTILIAATATGPSRKLTLRPSFAVRCQEDAD
ncbi:hypothetical protein R6G99_10800, partial [Actinotignum timonense]|nr:hypothetical protein [Actinotignum timonense]